MRVDWINNFIIGLITPPMIQGTGFGTYVFFAVFCFLSFIWVFFLVPETNGRSLEQMDEVFNDRSGTEEIARRREIMTDVIREKNSRAQNA